MCPSQELSLRPSYYQRNVLMVCVVGLLFFAFSFRFFFPCKLSSSEINHLKYLHLRRSDIFKHLKFFLDANVLLLFRNSFMLGPHQWRSGNTQNWKTGGARFKPQSRLSIQPFGDLSGFLQNSRKQGLGSLRKAPMQDILPVCLGFTPEQLALIIQQTN